MVKCAEELISLIILRLTAFFDPSHLPMEASNYYVHPNISRDNYILFWTKKIHFLFIVALLKCS